MCPESFLWVILLEALQGPVPSLTLFRVHTDDLDTEIQNMFVKCLYSMMQGQAEIWEEQWKGNN